MSLREIFKLILCSSQRLIRYNMLNSILLFKQEERLLGIHKTIANIYHIYAYKFIDYNNTIQ